MEVTKLNNFSRLAIVDKVLFILFSYLFILFFYLFIYFKYRDSVYRNGLLK